MTAIAFTVLGLLRAILVLQRAPCTRAILPLVSLASMIWPRNRGSAVAPGRKQYAELEAASNLAMLGDAEQIVVDGGTGKLSFKLPRQGVSLIVLDYE